MGWLVNLRLGQGFGVGSGWFGVAYAGLRVDTAQICLLVELESALGLAEERCGSDLGLVKAGRMSQDGCYLGFGWFESGLDLVAPNHKPSRHPGDNNPNPSPGGQG